MAAVDLEYNKGFQIYNANGTKFHDLVLHKCTYETVVMSLGDKISGILYYKDNALGVKMTEYIIYKGVKYTLVNPPTILKEGLVSDNGELKGMTKYSFTFYHPMYVLNNFSFNDVAVSSDQNKYLSQNKTFSWIGNLNDYVAKINKNLQGTEWIVKVGDNVTQEEKTKLSDVLSFDKNTIAEALKRGYETWEVPYIVDSIHPNEYLYIDEHNVQRDYYDDDKHFVVLFGLPTTEITVKDDNGFETPFVFKMGQGVGLKNNSRNPKNNKIITRIAGYGSEDNIPYGYPQIRYYGGTVQYPLYYGIVGGQRVQLIKHPFTRNHLMPSVYGQAVYNKVNPKLSDGSNNPNYNPDIELVDYYDADSTYANPIKSSSPSYEIHEFGDIKPELGEETIINAVPVNAQETQSDYKQKSDFLQEILNRISSTDIDDEKVCLKTLYDKVDAGLSYYAQKGEEGGSEYWYRISVTSDDYYQYVSYESGNYNFTATVLKNDSSAPTPDWDDTMDDDGKCLQSYFKITLPILSFDLYACAAITQEMKINMRSGACIGCTFPVQVDWDDYKRNFYNSDGEFDPDGEQRDYTKYPDSSSGQITVMVKKELETFGTLMPNQYQQPTTGDKFVILGISLPESYITNAEQRLDTDMKQYMRDNNVYYYEYPLKFDEHFLISNENILSQMKPNVVVRFEYAGETHALYIKQMSVKYNESPLPKYDITLTDDIEIVLNQIGQVTDEVSKLRLGLGENGIGGNGQEYLRKDIDDTARGTIRMIKGMQVGERFVTGLLGEGGVFRKDVDGTTYLETDKLYVRMKAYFDTVEVKHYLHTGGNRIASQASGIVCSRVEYIDNNGDVTTDLGEAVLFRCYFKANDGDKTIRNDFTIGDLAFCRETNVDVSEINMHSYWRLVIGRNGNGSLTENKEAWIDLSNRASETLTIDGKDYICNGYQNGSDSPIAQDDIIQLGNIANTDRQGAIVEYVGGEDAPSYQIFQGIGEDLPYPYTLENKNYIGLGYSSQTGRAYMNVYGDAYIGDPDGSTFIKYEQEDSQTHQPKMTIRAVVEFQSPDDPTQITTLEQFASAIVGDIENIQSQIDGEIDTWFYAGVPTLQNAPANEWTTDVEKEKHAGDLYYDIGTGTDAGKAYRFVRSQDKPYVYSWQYIDDTAITEALRIAAHAQDTADHKRRVFVAQPTPPYDEGDLWVNATYVDQTTQETVYDDDILKCITPKTEGRPFSITDWELASKYTDDTAFNKFFADTYQPFVTQIQSQVDGKAETWYQSTDPSAAWNTPELKQAHVGDIWHNTSSATVSGVEAGQDAIWSGSDWKPSTVPQEVYDKIDGKADIFVSKPSTYNANDMWIIESGLASSDMPSGCVVGDIVISSAARKNSYTKSDWKKKDRYTDDSSLIAFIGGYTGTAQELQNQIDKKAETWYQATNPASASGWVAEDHVGDLWYCTADISGTLYKAGTTWYYKDNGASANPRYAWVQQDIPDAVFDMIDGKAQIFVSQPSNYHAKDLWILAADTTVNGVAYKKGEVLTATSDSVGFNQAHWTKKVRYTDDSSLNDFKANKYVTQLTNGIISTDLKNAQDAVKAAQKAADDAQADANAAAAAAANAQTSANSANNRLDGWANDGSISPTEKTSLKLEWENVKKEYTQICNDADKYGVSKTAFAPAYTSANAAFQKYTAATPENITISADYNNIAAYYAARQTILDAITQAAKKVATDAATAAANAQAKADSAYTLAGNAQSAAQAAEAHAATLDYVKTALKQDTIIDGGLVISTLLAMRDGNNKIWSGINGAYNSAETGAGYKGHGIASWYGGVMVDKEVTTTATDYAKSLFRFDGSGYLAGGNITWDKNGIVTIANVYANIGGTDTSLTGTLQTLTNLSNALPLSLQSGVTYLDPKYSFTNLSVLGKEVATKEFVNDNFVTKAFFNRLFQAYSSSTIVDANKVSPNDTTTAINNLKILVGTWTNEYLSALGLNSSGSSGGGGGDVYWTQLNANNSSTGQQIHSSHLSSVTNPLSFVFNEDKNPTLTYDGKANKSVSGILTKSYADGRYVRSVKVGTTTYSPTNGVVSLPAYLPLAGGTMTGWLNFKFGHDLTQDNNGVTSIGYYGIRMYDKNNYFSAQFLNQVNTNGDNQININLRNRNGSTEYNKSFLITLTKRGVISASLGGAFTATSFIKSGGTASQFLKADGSVDSNSYLLTSDVSDWAKAATKPSYSFSEITGSLTAADIPNLAASKITSGTFDAARIPNLDWSKITGTPTTLSGYGITDGVKNTTKWWGRTIDASGKVSGNMTDVGSIAMTGNITITKESPLITLNLSTQQLSAGENYNIISVQYKNADGSATYTAYPIGILGNDNTNGFNSGVRIGSSNGTTIVGAGENSTVFASALSTYDDESLYLTADANIRFFVNMPNDASSSTEAMSIMTSGNVGIGTASPSQKLHVNGYTKTTRLYLSDTIYLVVENNGVHVVGGGLYADTYVSALGANTSSGGGIGDVTWTQLNANNSSTGQQIHSSHLSSVTNPLSFVFNEDKNPTLTYDGKANKSVSGILTKSYADERYVRFRNVGTDDLTSISGSFFFGGNVTLASGYDYAGFQAGYANDRWQMLCLSSLKWRQNDSTEGSSTWSSGWGDWRTICDSSNTYINGQTITINGTSITVGSGNGTVTAVKVGTTTYNPANGVITLPDYLAKTGGTMTGDLILKGATSGDMTYAENIHPKVTFKNAYESQNISLVFTDWDSYRYPAGVKLVGNQGSEWFECIGEMYAAGGNKVWHAGNDGSSSGLDADLLDGQHGSYYAAASSLGNYLPKTGGTLNGPLFLEPTGSGEGGQFELHAATEVTNQAGIIIDQCYSKLRIFGIPSRDGTTKTGVGTPLQIDPYAKTISGGYTLDGNASSATKLETERKLWGQSFDGTANVSGAISGATTISASSNVTVGGTLGVTGATTLSSTLNVSGNVGIGITPATKLHVKGRITAEYDETAKGSFCATRDSYVAQFGINKSGFAIFACGTEGSTSATVRLGLSPQNAANPYVFIPSNLKVGSNGKDTSFTDSSFVQIGEIRLVYHQKTSSLEVVKYDGSAANFYATGAVSALGANASGGSGSGIDANWLKTNDVEIKRLGIGVEPSSSYQLNVQGSSSFTGAVTINNALTVNNSVSAIGGFSTSAGSISCAHDITAGGRGLIQEILTVGQTSVNTRYNLYVNGTSYFNGNVGIGYYSSGFRLYVSGKVRLSNLDIYEENDTITLKTNDDDLFLETGGGTPYYRTAWQRWSDMNLKNIVRYINDLTIEKISKTPLFVFRWKDEGNSGREQVGTSAQYWNDILPQSVVKTKNGVLTLDYSSIALASAVVTARKVVDHELRIKQLEQENAILREEIKSLKAA